MSGPDVRFWGGAFVLGAALSAVASFAACKSNNGSSPTAVPTDESACAPTGNKNADVMNALSQDCAVCHSQGSNKPFFVSLASFEATLAYDTTYVVPGKPEESQLILLLKGQGTGTFTQMPTAGPTFAANDAAGKTKVTVADLEDWIRNLPPQSAPSLDYLKAATVRRLAADEVLNSLNGPLGLSDRDLFDETRGALELVDGDNALPARSPTSLLYQSEDSFTNAEVYPRYLALGGSDWLNGKAPDTSFSSTFLDTLTQMSQARCRKAVEKRGNEALFRFAKLSDTSERSIGPIKKNIGYLHLRLLGEAATDADIDDLYTNVYLPYEATDTETAWIAVCAALVRHPLWATY